MLSFSFRRWQGQDWWNSPLMGSLGSSHPGSHHWFLLSLCLLPCPIMLLLWGRFLLPSQRGRGFRKVKGWIVLQFINLFDVSGGFWPPTPTLLQLNKPLNVLHVNCFNTVICKVIQKLESNSDWNIQEIKSFDLSPNLMNDLRSRWSWD